MEINIRYGEIEDTGIIAEFRYKTELSKIYKERDGIWET
jgi:hypothetical protein